MTQSERRVYLIQALLAEQPDCRDIAVPADEGAQRRLLRGLFNVRMPRPVSAEFLAVQDAYLQAELAAKGITDYRSLTPVADGLYLWQGDITTLKCGAIVNAANSRLLGCLQPNHLCIDNAIHTFSGVQLRAACARLMDRQGHEEPTGAAKLTPAFNLPCDYVLHTVGPIVYGALTSEHEALLRSCYLSCLKLAEEHSIGSVAFCCISTGEFHFPKERAAQIAVRTVRDYKKQTNSKIDVIFNVFHAADHHIYRALL